jgi:hypothetical protein
MASQYDETTAFLQGVATDALNEAQHNASRIYSLPPKQTLREPNFSVDLTKPNIGPPPTFGDVFGADNTDPTIQYLDGQADAWIAKYFPELNACLKTLPEEWLCGVISGVKPFGMAQTVFEQVWHAARDRAYRTSASERGTLEADFSNRGFTLPPGALVDQLAQAERAATDAILAVNRDQAIKDAEIKLDLLKFAEEQAIRLKLGVMQSLSDFYRMWISVSDEDVRRAAVRAQAQSSLYAALASYYNVEISFQELVLRAAQLDAGVDIDVDRNRLTHEGHFGSVASALGGAVGAFAQVAGNAAQAGGSLTAQIEAV